VEVVVAEVAIIVLAEPIKELRAMLELHTVAMVRARAVEMVLVVAVEVAANLVVQVA
jgi:hypothetical protein